MLNRIDRDKELKFEHVVSFRKEIPPLMIRSELDDFFAVLKMNGYSVQGPLISVTYSQKSINGETIIDIEYLLPIDRPFDEHSSGYAYKPIFHLTHALKLSVSHAEPEQINQAYSDLTSFIEQHGLQQITFFYNATYPNQPLKNQLDIYVGINPSIL